MNEEQIEAFESAAKPLMKYLSENHNPHVTVIVNSTDAELLYGNVTFSTSEFIKD